MDEKKQMREILFRGQTRRLGELVRMNGEKVPSKWVYGGICQGEGAFSIIYGWKDEEPCPDIDDNYFFKENLEPLGFVKGESAIEFMKGGE